ncbi:hypothetical protein AK812_SmicGene40870 [Symbiodinium microadriaticum]|uniref:Uncharacterized protein n=1 Tax=Symbiodinium microadriaticum TaxID=2951 RepID=A0A1Q9C7L2_SYMMI|nr:hypothetical protein AK812_SmicGene40870 [Symbiodinium microadriaticum]
MFMTVKFREGTTSFTHQSCFVLTVFAKALTNEGTFLLTIDYGYGYGYGRWARLWHGDGYLPMLTANR